MINLQNYNFAPQSFNQDIHLENQEHRQSIIHENDQPVIKINGDIIGGFEKILEKEEVR